MPTTLRAGLRALSVVAAVGLGVATVGAAALLSSAAGSARRAAPRPAGHRPACGTPAPTAAKGYQAMFDAMNTAGWSGGDGASSVPLPDGRSLWLFGDTILGPEAPGGGYGAGTRMVHNSFVIQDRGCLRAVNGPRGGEVLPDSGTAFYWPTAGLALGDRLYVFAARVVATGDRPFDFRAVGTDLAVFALANGSDPRLLRVVGTPSRSAPDTVPQWGQAVLGPQGDGYVYVYATARVDAPYHFGRELYVARVRPAGLEDPEQWRFFAATGWSSTREQARALIASMGGVSTTPSVLRSGRSVVVVSKKDGFLGTDVAAWTGATPAGPFLTPTRLARAPSYEVPGELKYLPAAHPELRLASGRTLVTICRNNTDLTGTVMADADLYKPQFLEVSLPG